MNQFFNALYAAGHKSFDLAIERLVVLLRIALTAFCFVVINMSSATQPQFTKPFELILATYALFGVSVALLPTIGKYRTGWQLPVHLIDIGVVSILIYFIDSVSAAFFILYVFVLMSATFRWNWRGALWTTLALPALQLALFGLNGPIVVQFIIEWGFLFIVGGMFVFFGVARERNTERLTQIANWPNNRLQSSTIQSYISVDNPWLDASLNHIAAVSEAPRVLVLWEFAQEPYCFWALSADGKYQQDRTIAGTFDCLLSPELDGMAFATENIESNRCLTRKGIQHFVGPLINKSIQARFKISSVCSAPFSGEYCGGRVFILDRKDWGEDDLTMTEIVASHLHLELEYYALSVELRETAASRERIRLARDLHDGVLQTLTAAGLQLSSIASCSGQEVKHKLHGVRELLVGEQQRIRAFIEGRQSSPRNQHLHDEIRREIKKIEHQWGCSIPLSVTPDDATIPIELVRQIELVLAEAAANAVQHGNASRIKIDAEQLQNSVRLRITDNGRGLSGITGNYTQDELTAQDIGPRSICERIAGLGGTLSLSSSCKGVELRIELPYTDRMEQENQ